MMRWTLAWIITGVLSLTSLGCRDYSASDAPPAETEPGSPPTEPGSPPDEPVTEPGT